MKKHMFPAWISLILMTIFYSCMSLLDHNKTIPGKIMVPYPTVRNISFEWYIKGDENQNGRVSVHYRKTGVRIWSRGMPLRRVPAGKNEGFPWKNKHAVEHIELKNVFSHVDFPNPPVPERNVPDLRPSPGSRVVDAGVRLYNINDHYLGRAPDCGAYETGQELPHYGPRLLSIKNPGK